MKQSPRAGDHGGTGPTSFVGWSSNGALEKAPTGIAGLDHVTGGGLPRERTTLIFGGPGTGKTVMALEFLIHGAIDKGEPGLFVAFEETAAELTANSASLGFDLPALVASGRLRIDEVRLDRDHLSSAGGYDLEGLFIRLAHAIDAIGARRVVLDTVEVLFAGLPDPTLVRSELARLFRWLKDRGLTSIVTGERGEGSVTRHGLEEFVSDCVIALDHRVDEVSMVRRLRVVKYRGSSHGTDEYPFLIDDDGIWVLPVSAIALDYPASEERVSTGIPDLDAMLGGDGVFRGSAVLLSGTAGTGKTSIAGSFAAASCRRGERSVFFSFEQSSAQIIRDLGSIGVDLQPWVEGDLLRFQSTRPTAYGLEMHLSRMQRLIDDFEPSLIVVDPITTFDVIASRRRIESTIARLMALCRSRGITCVFTSLSEGGAPLEATAANISSVADVWLLVRDIESDGERNRALYVLKARGLPHSNQVREFQLRSDGIVLLPVHVDADGVKIGSARQSKEERERLADLARAHEVEKARLELDLRRRRHEVAAAALAAEFAADEARSLAELQHAEDAEAMRTQSMRSLAARREGTPAPPSDDAS
jgi:circadian clock protein KaiC